jgi:hypothetical protein
MEEKLLKWYHDETKDKFLSVTPKDIKAKAKEFCSVENFNASKGWLEKFQNKYAIVLVRSKRASKKV